METKLIWRTKSGQRAWECADSGLPKGYRRILDLAAAPVSVAKVVETLGEFPAKQVADWVDELETLGFIYASRPSELPDYLARQAA
jgi:hypothetical protein